MSNVFKDLEAKATSALNQGVDAVSKAFSARTSNNMSGSGQVYQYPLNVESQNQPFVFITRHRPSYSGGQVKTNISQHVSLYMPMGISINDSMVYETAATGAIGAAYANGVNTSNYTAGDIQSATLKYGPAAAGVAAGILPGGILGKLISGGTAATVAGAVANEEQKRLQMAVNPREFMLFKTPNIRSFSLRFRFMPESQEESLQVRNIIKFFRSGAYPETDGVFSMKFPDAFQIQFRVGGKELPGIPKLPEMVLETVGVSYNPMSSSFFKGTNDPIEISLSLDFKELKPLTREQVNGDF